MEKSKKIYDIALGLIVSGYLAFLVYLVLSLHFNGNEGGVFICIALACALSSAVLVLSLLLISRPSGRPFNGEYILTAALCLCCFCYAAPGFLPAPTRARISAAKSVLRNADWAIEEYQVAYRRLPNTLLYISREKSYIDPFSPESEAVGWILISDDHGILFSVGPDRVPNFSQKGSHISYDPTNGIKSGGDITRQVLLKDRDG